LPGNGGGGCDTELTGSVDMAFPGCVSFDEVWWLAGVTRFEARRYSIGMDYGEL